MASDTTKRGRGRPKKIVSTNININTEAYLNLLTKIDYLNKQLEISKGETDNMELAYKRAIHAKAELNDKVEQLTDDVRKFEELYVRAKGVAQALGKAVSILTTEVQNG